MATEILFINISEALSVIFFMIGCNVLLIYSMIRQKLPAKNLFAAFNIMKGFNKKERLISISAYNNYLQEYGVKPNTWIF
jgi:hypothetical protein